MRSSLAALIGSMLVATSFGAAQAFTVENKDAGGQYAAPKFDLEEQAKNFRKDGEASGSNKSMFETPLGSGKLQFGVSQGPTFGSPIGLGFGSDTQAQRREFDRRLAPPSSLEYNQAR